VVGGDDDDEKPLIAFLWVKKVTKFSQFVHKIQFSRLKNTRFLSLSLSSFFYFERRKRRQKSRGGASNERVPTSPFFVRWRAASAAAAAAAAAKLLRCVTGEENLDF
jgi:hypothetical protein